MRRALVVVLAVAATVVGIGRGETAEPARSYVRIPVADRAALDDLARSVELDERTRPGVAYAWLKPGEREQLEARGFVVEPVAEPRVAERAITMCSDPGGPPYEPPFAWNCYPTWSQYVDMMEWYAATYPTLCRLVDLGPSGTGDHDLLALVISDNVHLEEDEPEFLYTSSMHGDELTGYVLTLRLADALLTGYGADPELTALVDGLEIWINPLANPDGTFAGGDATVAGAQRYSVADDVDLNRSFPDPGVGDDPSAGGWPAEVQRMVDIAAAQSFVMAANFHGGAEVVNYPWDYTYTLHVDDAWFQTVSHEYADNAQAASPAGYMSGFDDGITNGAAWYVIDGGRQDFMNYYHGCREVTIEISDTKLIDSGQLDAHWTWNRQALLDYMKRSLTGIRGLVTDAVGGGPVAATVKVVGHDLASQRSWVYSDPDAGNYHRPIAAGTWSLEVSAAGYETATFPGVVVVGGTTPATRADVALNPLARYSVSGLVTDAVTGAAIPGAEVELVGTTIPAATTAGDGVFLLAEVWEGDYTLRASHAGHGAAEAPITVDGGPVVQDLVLEPIDALVDLDFEATNGGLVSSAPSGWQWGTDSLAGSHSGSKVWGTVLGADYLSSVLWTLDVPAVVVPAEATTATLVFWHWYDTESGYDGGHVQVSVDGGSFTRVTPVGGYPDSSVDGLGNQPGWSGSSGGWREVRVDLPQAIGHSVTVRFRFGSDGSVVRRGWYLDDLRLETTGGQAPQPMFADGFESGDLSGWDAATGHRCQEK